MAAKTLMKEGVRDLGGLRCLEQRGGRKERERESDSQRGRGSGRGEATREKLRQGDANKAGWVELGGPSRAEAEVKLHVPRLDYLGQHGRWLLFVFASLTG